ncbi:MAG TPA: cytidylate kinase-like family protein [Gaiellaceae bacterium]|nr:cytidylate kinase-like family protein [Gaiellaceae bacterium]
MPCSVICVSHATGSGGYEVGRLVAERLGFLQLDEEIVARAAARGGLSPADVADEERRKSVAVRILGSISEGSSSAATLGGAVPFLLGDEPSKSDIRVLIREAIEQAAARGDVVITAHAASHALDPGARILRVLVTASPRTRAKRVSEQSGVDIASAERTVKTADAARRDYLKRFYDVAAELPTHYDLVVNTDGVSVEEAAALVAQVAAGRA